MSLTKINIKIATSEIDKLKCIIDIYRVANANKTGGFVSSALTYTSNSGVFEGFKRFAIRIDMLSPNIHNAPTLKDYRGIALT